MKIQSIQNLALPVDAVFVIVGAAVWVQSGVNKFKYKMVELGQENGDRIEIRTGLKTGDIVKSWSIPLEQRIYI
jgi:Cu(I)/Ag(I) efflux system membrane fusion protein